MSYSTSSLYQRAFSASPTYGDDAYAASASGWQAPYESLSAPAAFAPTVILGALDNAGAAIGRSTQDATPVLFGTGTPGETLQFWATAVDNSGLIVNSYPVGQAVVQADGSWQFNVPQVPQSAQYNFQVTDGQGQSASLNLNITDVPTLEPVHHDTRITGAIDHVGPVTGELANGATTDDTRPTFHGTGNPGELLNVVAIALGTDGQPTSNIQLGLGTALVQPDGTWQFTAPYAIQEGTYDVYVGHGIVEGDAFRLTIDNTAGPLQPYAVTITGAIDHAGPVTGELTNGATTDDTQPTLHGTGTPNSLVSVFAVALGNDGNPIAHFEVGKAIVALDGTWQFTPDHALPDGTFDFHISQGSEDSPAFRLVIDRAWTDGMQPEQPDHPFLPVDPVVPDQPVPPEPPVAKVLTLTGAVDHAGPVTGELTNGATTDDTRPTFHGTGTPNTLIDVVAVAIGADGKPVTGHDLALGKAIVQQDGTWQFTPDRPLQDGTYDVHVSHGIEDSTVFHLTIDRSWTDQTTPDGNHYSGQSHGLELDLGHLVRPDAQDNASSGKATLPSLSHVLEQGSGDLSLIGGNASYTAPIAGAPHFTAADFHPASFDALNAQYVVV